jgi:peptidoglycan/LPS O-acetylase OafA/YrhL
VFFIAGYFARLLLERRGAWGFWANRRQRILYPFLVFWVVLIPLTGAVWVVGILRDSGWVLPKAAPAATHVVAYFPLMHLWFLYYLLIFYVLVFAIHVVLCAIDRRGVLAATLDGLVRFCVSSGLAGLLLGLPVLYSLVNLPRWDYFSGIPTPDNSLLPSLPAAIGYGTAMLFGWVFQRQPGNLPLLQRRWPIYLGIALAGTAVCFGLLGTQSPLVQVPRAARLTYALAYETAAWSWMLAITGAALRFASDYSPVRRYLADASYWMYLMHLPVVVGIAVWIGHWPLHWSLKYPLTLALSVSLLLVSYHYLVRPTFIGRLLNGRRYPIGRSKVLSPAQPSATA